MTLAGSDALERMVQIPLQEISSAAGKLHVNLQGNYLGFTGSRKLYWGTFPKFPEFLVFRVVGNF
jgi:hypothetical protein